MGRGPCCEGTGLKRGPWALEEDRILVSYIQTHGHANWRTLPKEAGLQRCGKSCRLRWLNYLRPDIKRGGFTKEEEDAIIHLHQVLGNRWSVIAARLPGRTDNEIKNVWHTHLKKRLTTSSPSSLCGGGGIPLKRGGKAKSGEDLQVYPAVKAMISSMSSGVSYCCSSSGNTVDSPTSVITTADTNTVHEIVKYNEHLSDQMMPQLQDHKSSFWSMASAMPSNAMYGAYESTQTKEGSLILHNQRQNEEEDTDEFWLKLLVEAEAIAESAPIPFGKSTLPLTN